MLVYVCPIGMKRKQILRLRLFKKYRHIIKNVFRFIIISFVLYMILLVSLCIFSYAYFYYTNPSWEKLENLISDDKIIIIDSNHDKNKGYHAEFEIYIPNKNDRSQFISSIERIGSSSLIDVQYYKDGKAEYYFPINEFGIWVHVLGKDGRYYVEYTYMFTPLK